MLRFVIVRLGSAAVSQIDKLIKALFTMRSLSYVTFHTLFISELIPLPALDYTALQHPQHAAQAFFHRNPRCHNPESQCGPSLFTMKSVICKLTIHIRSYPFISKSISFIL